MNYAQYVTLNDIHMELLRAGDPALRWSTVVFALAVILHHW
jgi:hypothetical protein